MQLPQRSQRSMLDSANTRGRRHHWVSLRCSRTVEYIRIQVLTFNIERLCYPSSLISVRQKQCGLAQHYCTGDCTGLTAGLVDPWSRLNSGFVSFARHERTESCVDPYSCGLKTSELGVSSSARCKSKPRDLDAVT